MSQTGSRAQCFLGNSVFKAVFLWLQNVKASFGLPVKSNSFDRIIFSLLVTLLCCSVSPYYAIIQIRSSPGTLQFSLFCVWLSPLSSAFPGCSQPIFFSPFDFLPFHVLGAFCLCVCYILDSAWGAPNSVCCLRVFRSGWRVASHFPSIFSLFASRPALISRHPDTPSGSSW